MARWVGAQRHPQTGEGARWRVSGSMGHVDRSEWSVNRAGVGGGTIAAIEFSDCGSPKTTPCSEHAAFWVIRLVKAGRTIPVPDDATALTIRSKGIPCVNPS